MPLWGTWVRPSCWSKQLDGLWAEPWRSSSWMSAVRNPSKPVWTVYLSAGWTSSVSLHLFQWRVTKNRASINNAYTFSEIGVSLLEMEFHSVAAVFFYNCVSVAVSNAGMGLIGPIECQSLDEMKTVMDTNFFGLVRLIKEILPDMKKRKKGHIVVISSVMGIQGEHLLPTVGYSSSSFSYHSLSFSFRLSFCSFQIWARVVFALISSLQILALVILANISFSVSGILFNDIYAASKFAVEGFCECLAVQALRFKLK